MSLESQAARSAPVSPRERSRAGGQGASFCVRDLLEMSVLADAQVVAGAGGVSREVRWIAVSEGPVEDFVERGEVILTSGMGYDADQFGQIVRELIESGAAGICLGIGPGRFAERAGEPAKNAADEADVPLIEIPWETRFADITRAVVDRLLADRYGSLEPDELQTRFIDAVVDGRGFRGIADALGRVTGRPALVFDADFRPIAFSRAVRTSMGDRAVQLCLDAAERLSAEEVAALAGVLAGETPHDVPGLPALGLGSGLGMAVLVGQRPAAYVYVLRGDAELDKSECDAVVMERARSAVAMEALRQQTATESEARARGHFLWSVAASPGEAAEELTLKASMLGYSGHSLYEVMVAELADGHENGAGRTNVAREGLELVERRLRQAAEARRLTVHTARRDAELLVLVEGDATGSGAISDLAATVHDELASASPASVAFGIARKSYRLADLGLAYSEACQALVIGRQVLGEGCIAPARDLAPYLMLGSLGEDPSARGIALETLRDLANYDQKTSRSLIDTLEVYLDERGNASAAARRLFLNRHSLLYRLKKIEEMTGRSLEDPNDLFVLELSLRLLRFNVLSTTAADAPD